jgi:hypothetical protein
VIGLDDPIRFRHLVYALSWLWAGVAAWAVGWICLRIVAPFLRRWWAHLR